VAARDAEPMTQAADDGSMERAPFRDSPGQPRSHSATSRWKGVDAPAAALTPRSSPRARYPWMETAPFQDAPAPTPAILAPTLLSVDGRAWMPPQLPHPTVLARDSPVMLAPAPFHLWRGALVPCVMQGRDKNHMLAPTLLSVDGEERWCHRVMQSR
jgi:hypothetical protein